MSNRIAVAILVLSALIPTACRTYGGYGSEEAALAQIESAHQIFARDLVQAKNDLRVVAAAAEDDPSIADIAIRLQELVATHELVLVTNEALVVEARANAGSYRLLNRTLGGMLSEQELIYGRYRDVLRAMVNLNDTSSVDRRIGTVVPRYHVVPPYFERVRNASYIRSAGNVSRALKAPAVIPADEAPPSVPTDTAAVGREPGAPE